MAYKLASEVFNKKKKCVIYIRVSSERQVEGFSLDGQKRELIDYAGLKGLEVANIYVEEGKSGKNIEGRDEFQKMIYEVTKPDSDVGFILVFKLSRFGRNVRDILNTINLIQKYGVSLLTKDEGLDSSTATGHILIAILGTIAEMERENISTQTWLGREEKARQGGWNGGFAPYGYDVIDGHLEPNEQAYIVKLIYEKYVVENMGMKTVANYLNKKGIKKVRAKNRQNHPFDDWSSSSVKSIIDNPIYTGYIAFGKRRTVKCINEETGEIVYKLLKQDSFIQSDEQSHEALVSKETWDKAQQIRKNRAIRGNKNIGNTPKHLLSSILKCPDCGTNMVINYNKWCNQDGSNRLTRTYICGHYNRTGAHGQCKRNGVDAQRIEQEVISYTKKLVSKPEFADYVQQKIGKSIDLTELENEAESYDKKLKTLERNKDKLSSDIDNLMDDDSKIADRKRADMNKRLDKIYEEMDRVESEKAECISRINAVREQELTRDAIFQMLLDFNKIYDKLSEEEQHELLKSLISEIQLYKKDEVKETKTYIKKIKYAFELDNIAENLGNKDNHVEPWQIKDREGRLDLTLTPSYDRTTCVKLLWVDNCCHQMFGKFCGTAVLDDGTVLEVQDVVSFAEHAVNNW